MGSQFDSWEKWGLESQAEKQGPLSMWYNVSTPSTLFKESVDYWRDSNIQNRILSMSEWALYWQGVFGISSGM